MVRVLMHAEAGYKVVSDACVSAFGQRLQRSNCRVPEAKVGKKAHAKAAGSYLCSAAVMALAQVAA